MPSASYHFVTRWRVLGTPEEVFRVLEDPRELPRWWPSVYLAAREAEPGGEDGVGRAVVLLTRGWLPYELNWLLRVLSPLFSSVLAANHRWAMARGEESLVRELARRRAGTDAEIDRLPPPPAPARHSGFVLAGATRCPSWVWRRRLRAGRGVAGARSSR